MGTVPGRPIIRKGGGCVAAVGAEARLPKARNQSLQTVTGHLL
jgi:hypothetical protein